MIEQPVLELERLTVQYSRRGSGAVLKGLSLAVEAGAFLSIVGPSGCGKSTLLHAIAGFLQGWGHVHVDGTVRLRGKTIAQPGIELGYVGQRYTLFNWLTIEQNIAFGLRHRGLSETELRLRVERLLAEIGLTAHAHAWPEQLSGGMQQRAALARAMAPGPAVLLLDEPFSALDTETRRKMQALLLRLWGGRETVILFVTHDIDEALLLSDRVMVLSATGQALDMIEVPFSRPRATGIEHTMEFRALYDRIAGMFVQPSSS
jgi:NitT/TauT family transport system ATP-binding protein